MKYILSFLFAATAFVTQAQQKAVLTKNTPVYFLDSVRFKKLPIIDPNTIESIDVLKNDVVNYPNGAIYIKQKPDARYNLVTLESVAQQRLGTAKPYMAMIDNEFVTDVTDLMIDSSFILNCEVLSSRDFVNLQHFPEIMIIKLTTATKENKARSAAIKIRG